LYDARNERRELQYELEKITREQSNLLKSMTTEKMLKDIEDKIDNLIMDAPWGMSARNYQLIDLKYMLAAFETGKTGVLNANDMGLGKTFESIMLDYCLQHLFPAKYDRMPLVLWVTTPSLIKQTVREIKRWNPGRRVIPIEGSWNKEAREFAARMAIEELALVVCNYEQLNTNKVLMNTEWDIIFADEVSKLKGGANPGKPTKVWLNFKQLLWETKPDRYGVPQYTDPYDPTPRAKFFIPLSGTPIQNKPGDMWAYLHLFKPTSFPRLKNFEREYAYGWPDVKVNFERLINVMSDQVIRRSKKDELDLPAKVYEMREVELKPQQRKIYDQMKAAFFAFLDGKGEQQISATVVIEWIIRLWELALYPGIIKIFDEDMNQIPVECQESAILDEAEDLIEEIVGAEEKTVVFSAWFNGPLHELKRRLDEKGIKAALYTGDQNTDQRDAAVQGFTEGDIDVLLCNMKAAGYGLNLQNASQAIFLDSWWNPAVNEQAEDRLHRMGQKGTVVIHKLVAQDTVYDFVMSKAAEKAEMSASIMESRELRKSSDWRDYLEGMI
jgi:SNF2 family DNA or RNA helicase